MKKCENPVQYFKICKSAIMDQFVMFRKRLYRHFYRYFSQWEKLVAEFQTFFKIYKLYGSNFAMLYLQGMFYYVIKCFCISIIYFGF